MSRTVFITDHAWPDLEIERGVIESAGLRLAAGPSLPAPEQHIVELVQQHQPASILTCWAVVNRQAIEAAAGLVQVGRIGVGLDNIDVAACTARGVQVTNVPDYCVEEVSDHALGFALAWARGLVALDRDVRAGQWNPATARLRRLCTLTVGLVGLGRIGATSARKFSAMGCRVLAHSASGTPQLPGVSMLPLPQLLQSADIVVLHLPLNDHTRGLMNRDRLARMKPGALLINLSRGGVVDNDALIDALESGHLGAAALDVLDGEPQVPARLLAHPGVMFTPHVAFSSDASLAELRRRAAEEAVRVLAGRPAMNPCNAPAMHPDFPTSTPA